ncbi:serine/threonine-protein kinase [Rheinheimera sp. F8]|uniref:serine/threonine-protein kinase n=1 Tax=Rheinheimera sp. F8 TaxID=1763998 RepID=UPI000744CF9C|nr:serine/threonine-protein kinase [Rheinheimera sp. F8]ALZ76737.1 hypothetical protein ATY27_13845 [Rheinheimera sp. F8]
MDQIGKYRVIRVLGQGGFGTVFLAEDPKLKLQVAIKVYTLKDTALAQQITSASQDAAQVLKDRFLNEARILRQLSRNPYVIELYDFDALADGTPYYVMPYLEKSLVDEVGKDALDAQVLAELPQALRPRKLGLTRTLQVIDQLLQALSDVHAAGLVHRDIKPANVLVAQDGDIRLTDFGVAKLPDTEHSQTGLALGSRNYMSPEQRESAKQVDARSDIYSVGVLMYRLISGTLPVGRFADALHYEPVLGDGINRWILACLETDKTKRFPDATAALSAFRQAKEQAGTSETQSEQTSTFVQGSGSTLKSELKPLQQKIASLLQTVGMVDSTQLKTLYVLADIAGVTENELNQLVEETKNQQNAQTLSFMKWRTRLEATVAKFQGQLPPDEHNALLAAGVHLGKSESDLLQFFPPATGTEKSNTTSLHANTKTFKTQDAMKKKTSLVVASTLTTLLITAAGYYGYQNYQRQEITRTQELNAWQQAKTTDTVQSYQTYLTQYPNGQYQQSARKFSEQLTKTEQDAAKLEANREQQALKAEQQARQAQQITIKLAQQWLIKLGYEISETGEWDPRTKTAVAAFEKTEKMLHAGVIDKTLLQKLEEVYWRNDKNAFAKAKAQNTTQSYQQYLDSQTEGKFRSEAEQEKSKLHQLETRKEEAKKAAQLAAKRESTEAKELRMAADEAYFVQTNSGKALNLYERASKLGSVYADAALACIHADGVQGQKNIVLARQYREEAERKFAQFDNLGAVEYFLLGRMSEFVDGANSTAITYYQKAAAEGYAPAQHSLGFLYYYGQYFPQSATDAFGWINKAAAQNYAKSQNFLGVMYEEGRGVPQSYQEASRWFRAAAEQGDLIAQTNLGKYYLDGRGVSQSYSEAYALFLLAAEQEYPEAQYFLGLMYQEGKGVRQSVSDAVSWYQKAAKQGDENAQEALEKLGVGW